MGNQRRSILRKRVVTTVLLLCLLVYFCQAVIAMGPGGQEDALKEGIAWYLTARRIFYNAEAPTEEAKKKLLAVKEFFGQRLTGAEQYYWLAMVEFTLAELEEMRGEKRAASQAFTECSRWAEKALKANKGLSDAHRILADSYMRLMSYNGAIYTMSKAPQAVKLLNKAISLDKKNYAAFIALGVYYLNAPAIGGGSVEKGIEALRKALESKDEFDLFLSYLWLGKAYGQLKKEEEARACFNKALEIYPQSPWAMEWLNQLK